MEGIAYWITKRATINPNRIAIITEHEQFSYKDLDLQIRTAALFLVKRLGVKKGERIAILSQNRLEYIVLLFAIAKIECVAVPLNIRLTENELEYQLNDSGTKYLFAEKPLWNIAESLRMGTSIEVVTQLDNLTQYKETEDFSFNKVNESAPFIICYTSGTTGKPKGAVLTQANMFWNAMNNVLAIDITSKDRSIVLLPLFHIGGIGLFALPTLFAGGSVIIPGKFDPSKALAMIEKYQATIVMGVPAIHDALIRCPLFNQVKMNSVRWFYNGGAPCPPKLIKDFIDKGFLFGQGFGMTETSPTIFMLSQEDAKRKIGSIGKPVFYSEYKLLNSQGTEAKNGDIGELVVRGPNVMKEYWNNPDATKETIQDGWLFTGDLARADEEGFLYIVGRRKDMIISGGENIYPLEIEQVIGQLSDVKETAVVGVEDATWGEVPVAFIAKKEGSPLDEKAIREHCRSYLGKYKVPKEIVFLDELPKNATGKIQKSRLVLAK